MSALVKPQAVLRALKVSKGAPTSPKPPKTVRFADDSPEDNCSDTETEILEVKIEDEEVGTADASKESTSGFEALLEAAEILAAAETISDLQRKDARVGKLAMRGDASTSTYRKMS